MEAYDFIIVGAGSSGCVLAERLSASGRFRIAVIESGSRIDGLMITMPRGVGRMCQPGDARIWSYDVSQGGNRPANEVWIKGRAIGGSSAVNGMIYTRGMPADFDGWAAQGCREWGWEEIGRCYRAIEDHELGAGPWRGAGGPVKISLHPDRDNPAIDAMIAAAQAIGTGTAVDLNDVAAVSQGAIGYYPRNIGGGERYSAARAFLRPALKRANVTLLSRTDVLGLVHDGGRVSGVRVRHAGAERIVHATREVILSAGAIHTPKLLQLSGIGASGRLRALGIEVVVDAPEVGEGLREHRFLPLQYRVKAGSHNHELRGRALYRSLLRYLLFRRGVMTYSAWEGGGFIKTDPSLPLTDAQIGIGLYSVESQQVWSGERLAVAATPGLSIGGYCMRPLSRGSVRIASADPDAAPLIDANYFAEDYDRRTSVGLVRWIRRMMAKAAEMGFEHEELSPGPKVETDHAIVEAFLTMGNPGYHVCGTCAMGVAESSVVDPRLRVRGIAGLRVADTSIMPTMISTNTNAAAMAIGWRAAELILEDAAAQRATHVA